MTIGFQRPFHCGRRFSATKRRERLPWPKDQPFRILSIDGGGIKGIYPAAVLAQLEMRQAIAEEARRKFLR